MMERALQAISQLGERERRMVIVGGIVALILLILAVLMPLQRSVGAATRRVDRERGDLAWLQSVAPQLGALRNSTPRPLRESLVVLVDQTARDAGIGKSLVGSQPSSNGALTVRLEQAPFDQMVTWLSNLGERYGVHAQSATIDADKNPGTVDATLELRAR